MASEPQETEDYKGYNPQCIDDFEVVRPQQRLYEDGPISPASTALTSPLSLPKDEPKNDYIALATLVIAIIFFIIALSLGAAADCKIGLCEKIDRSSKPGSSYKFQVFEFEAPLRYAWAAFTVAVFGLFLLSLYTFFLKKRETGTGSLKEVSALALRGCRLFAIDKLKYLPILLIPLFILVGFGSTWRAAGSYAIGALLSIIAAWLCVLVVSRGAVRTASSVTATTPGGMQVALRTAAIVCLIVASIAVGGLAATYMIFQDVRALSGFAMGTFTTALYLQITGGIFARATWIGDDLFGTKGIHFPENETCNPAALSNAVSSNVSKISGLASYVFALYSGAISGTSILGASLPFTFNNSYAMCVFNHLSLDQTCVAFDKFMVKASFAAGLCRFENFHTRYPALKTWESNTVFVALPFIIGFVGLLAATVSTAYTLVPSNADEHEENVPRQKHITPFLHRIRINVLIAAVITIICAAAVCFTLFGNNSSFQKASNIQVDRYELPSSANETTRCFPTQTEQSGLPDDSPVLNVVKGPYRPIDTYGTEYPRASQTAWRLFLCTILGVLHGLLITALFEYGTSFIYWPARRVASRGEDGTGAVMVEGLSHGMLYALGSITILISLLLSSYKLYGAYGVALASLGISTALIHGLFLSAFSHVIHTAESISALSGIARPIAKERNSLNDVGSTLRSGTNGLLSTCAALVGITLLFVAIQEADLVASVRQVGGEVGGKPSRHVTDIDGLDLANIYVLFSALVGIFLPFLYGACIMMAFVRGSYKTIAEIRRQACANGEILRVGSTQRGDHSAVLNLARGTASREMVLPIVITFVAPLIIGLGLGQRSVLGFAVGLICSALVTSYVCLQTAGVWDNARRYAEYEELGRDTGRHSLWIHAVYAASGFGEGLEAFGHGLGGVILFCVGVVVSTVDLMGKDASRWWIGVIIVVLTVLVAVGLMFVVGRVGDVEDETEGKMGINAGLVSPFYEEGPLMMREHMNPMSELAAIGLEPGHVDDGAVRPL